MDNIQIIRTACIAANPSILDLKFGCEVQVATTEGYGGTDIINEHHRLTAEDCKRDGHPEYLRGAFKIERGWLQTEDRQILGRRNIGNVFRLIEILGRPIRFADVLLALKEREGDGSGRIWIDERGTFKHGDWITTHSWNLRQDDLTAQTPETLAFLASLLANHHTS